VVGVERWAEIRRMHFVAGLSTKQIGQLDFLHGRENVVLLGPLGRGSQCTFLLRE
jgi:hypothetical protein